MERYAITGGPGCGKSTVLKALEIWHGEHIVKEVAQDYIELKQANGTKEPWMEPDFQDEILRIQLQRNARVHPNAERVFLDRDVPDGLAYAPLRTPIYERITAATGLEGITKVFLIENMGSTETNEMRHEDQTEALELERKLEQVYKTLGHEPIRIPTGTPKERVDTLLAHLE